MKFITNLILAFTFGLFINSCVNHDINKKTAHQPTIDLVWKTKDSLRAQGKVFNMYFFFNNDTVSLISEDLSVRWPYQFKKDSLILGQNRLFIKRNGDNTIDIYEDGSFRTSVEERTLYQVISDSYITNYRFYYSDERPLNLEDEIFMDPK
jgi:hypothetical protein